MVDDNADGRFILSKSLRRKFPQCLVLECIDSALAVATLKSQPVSEVLAHRAADVDGISLIRLLREPQKNANVGDDFFAACARPDAGPVASACLEGERQVFRGELPHFLRDYPADTPNGKRWFRLHVVPVDSPEAGLAVAHFEITPTQLHAGQGTNGSS